MRFIAFRNLVGVTHTEAEAKALAAECMVRRYQLHHIQLQRAILT
jgi:hypothetical protein